MFHKPFETIRQGDRAGICVTQFDPKCLERGLICSPGALPTLFAAVAKVSRIPYFSGDIATKSKFHVTIGHSTVMARILLFESKGSSVKKDSWVLPRVEKEDGLDFSREYNFLDKLEAYKR